MENNKNKKSVKFQGDMLNFCDFIQVFVFTRNHHLNQHLFSKNIVESPLCVCGEVEDTKHFYLIASTFNI